VGCPLSPVPLPVVKIREVSSAMSLKYLPAVLARSLHCPKRVVPSSGNLESMAACPSGKWSGELSKCALKSSTRIKCWLSLCASETSVSVRPFHTLWDLKETQRKRRQWARELPAYLHESSTPYSTTIHAIRDSVRLSKPQMNVWWSVCQNVFTHKSTYPTGRRQRKDEKHNQQT